LGIGTPTNSAVRFVGLTANTSPGTYGVRITVAPQKAVLGGASDPTLQDLSSTGLTNAEVLSFTYSSDYSNTSPNVTAFAVTLAAGSKINDIVTAMTSQFSTEGVGLSASNDGGKLKITSKDAGSDIRFTVVSDQAGATQTGIGTVGRTAQGVDIAGTINDHAATGKGNVLTSHSGFAEDGLQISSDTTTTGLFGRVSVSRGVGDRLSASLGAYTDPTTGIFITKSDSLQKTIDDMSKQIQTINDRITADGNRLRDQLVRLESTLGQLQATSNFLTNQLSKLPTFGTTTNK
jgi:flagellar hook-associated protein 2